MAIVFDDDEDFLIHQIIRDVEDAEEENAMPNRQHYERIDAFEVSDNVFIKNFRLTKELARELIEILTPFLNPPSRNSAINIETKVLAALYFYGHGCYGEGVGKNVFTALSQPSVSRVITEVTNALTTPEIVENYIKFPHNLNELTNLRNRFFRKYNFPYTVGCIDGTHIAIVRPSQDEHVYVNRKNYHSLNVQVVCDENLIIMNVNSRFPGSCHDAHVWRQSNISQTMERIYNTFDETFFLLGDSGYPFRPWLFTAIQDPPPNTPEERFSNRLKSVRSSVERCIGVWKNRFRCLLKYRTLHYAPHTAAKIVVACAVLHNICISNNVPEPELDDVELDIGNINNNHAEVDPMAGVNPQLAEARRLRERIIATHFAIPP